MSTHNICFRWEIRKLFTWYPLLSRPMSTDWNIQNIKNRQLFNLYLTCYTYLLIVMTFQYLFMHKASPANVKHSCRQSLNGLSALLRGWLGVAKVLCILRHRGVHLILTYSWPRLAILVAGKSRGGMFSFLLFLILLLHFSVLLALQLPWLGKRELILVLFVHLFDLRLFGFVCFLFL